MLKKYISIPALIIAGVISAFFILMATPTEIVTPGQGSYSTIDLPDNDTAFGGLFAQPKLDISLPHYIYQRLEDSIKQIQQAQQMNNKSFGLSGISKGPIGVFAINKDWANVDNKEQRYYLALNNYKLDPNTKFFIQNGTFNLAYVKWDKVVHNKHDSTRVGHYERKQIPVRYASEDKRLLIPISKKQYHFVYSAMYVVIFIWLFVAVYIFIGLLVQILINISKGKAFNTANIRRFNIMAWAALVIALVGTFNQTVLGWLFNNLIPDEFERPSVWQNFFNHLYLYGMAIALFIVARAFQKGYHLQQDQDLTI